MKKLVFLAAFLVISIASGCGPSKTTYIEILEPDRTFYGGQVDYYVQPGDILKVTESKTCRGGRGTCWYVYDLEKKKTGIVSKKRMEERHRAGRRSLDEVACFEACDRPLSQGVSDYSGA